MPKRPSRRNKPRAGRPRQDADREPNGRIARKPDHGTPETQVRRAALATFWDAKKKLWAIGDMSKTSTPLDTLLANQTITQDQHDAGEDFGRWYRAVYGRANQRRPTGGEVPDKVLLDYQSRLDGAINALKGLSRAHLDLAVNVCAYERFARWMPVQARLDRDLRTIDKLKAGLDAIVPVARPETRRAA